MVTQQGQNGEMQMTSDVTYVGNTVVASNTVKTVVLKAPVNQYQKVGTFDFSAKAMGLVDYAEHFEGSNYRYGASGPYSFDCSGYTQYIFS